MTTRNRDEDPAARSVQPAIDTSPRALDAVDAAERRAPAGAGCDAAVPLIDPDEPLGLRVRAVVDEIAAAVAQAATGCEPSLAGGLAGMAVFHAYLCRDRPDVSPLADSWLSSAVDALAAAPMLPSLYAGYTGVAWAVDHLRDDLGIPADDDPVAEIDDALIVATSSPWSGVLDAVDGLAGFAVHACARLDRRGDPRLLAQLVHRLAERAVIGAGGARWPTPPALLPAWQRAIYPDGYDNLGLAHGMPGVLWALAAAITRGVEVDRARALLDAGVAWLRAQRRRDGGFDRIVAPSAPPSSSPPARVAWCYGDLGVAVALVQVGRVLADAALVDDAIALARRAATRSPEDAGIVDAGLCHGAAGVAHLCHRLARTTGDPVLRDAARGWIAHTLALHRPGHGVAGFAAWEPDGAGGGRWRDDPGWLTGAAGIGLALVAAISRRAPAWDQVLLASMP